MINFWFCEVSGGDQKGTLKKRFNIRKNECDNQLNIKTKTLRQVPNMLVNLEENL